MTQLEAARKGIITEEMAIPKAIRIYETQYFQVWGFPSGVITLDQS